MPVVNQAVSGWNKATREKSNAGLRRSAGYLVDASGKIVAPAEASNNKRLIMLTTQVAQALKDVATTYRRTGGVSGTVLNARLIRLLNHCNASL